MGFYPQPNLWQCGPFALKHALIMLGIFAEEKEISKIAGTSWWSGSNELQLARATRKYRCSLRAVRKHDPDNARREILSYLRRGIPCLLCVDEWSHWSTVVKAEQGKFILLDSREDAILTIVTWSQLKNMWVYHYEDEYNREIIETIFDFHPVVPKFRVRTKAKFSLARAKYLRRPENRVFSRMWDEYVTDLLDLCKPRTALSENVISLGEFLRRHADTIIDQVVYWHGGVQQRDAKKILNNMHFVADTYGLVIHMEDEKRAIAGITSILTLWAASRDGVLPVYRPVKKKKRKRRG